jgi:membrane dipeptidase
MITATHPDLRHEAARVHSIARPLDAHTDVPLLLDRPGFDFTKRRQPDSPLSQVDLPRMFDGGVAGIFFAVFTDQGPLTPEGRDYAFALAQRIFARIGALLAANPASIALARDPADFHAITASGRTAVFLGVENGWPVGTDLSRLAPLHALGTRYLGLCHLEHNDLCDSSTGRGAPPHGGLSALGRDAVRECNRLGILVDVSHASDDAARQAAALSRAPIIASHSNCKTVYDHPRNLPDDVIRLIADRGGVIHATLCNPYVAPLPQDHPFVAAMSAYRAAGAGGRLPSDSELIDDWTEWESIHLRHPPPLGTVAQFVDHVEHIIRIAGIDHVGFGSDFNGGGIVTGCEDISRLPFITAELVRRGHSEKDIRKFWGENTLRILASARA